ncbi:MAG TPA: amidase [Candidatus Dormibacteraeota bacterium]|nr:amidase [Candidatus Dormibacteraeota bacterium]
MDFIGLTAIELAALVHEGKAKPSEIVAEHLRQVEAAEPVIHAFLTVRTENAMEEARSLDLRPDLKQLPLAGVPVGIKDSVAVAGEPIRLGSLATTDQPAAADDEIVKRLRAAGCVVIGKTRQPELAYIHATESNFGVTRNPWNLERSPGGSSGGSSAAVASAELPIAQASDGGGSIRIPAAYCGLFGIKPGPGLVPIPGGHDEHWFGLSQWGPLATTVADGALVLDVMAATSRFRDPRPPSKRLRIAVSTKSTTVGGRVDRDLRRAVEETADALRQAGHLITIADPPYSPRLSLAYAHRFIVGMADEVDEFKMQFSSLEPRTQRLVRIGRYLRTHHPVPPNGADLWRDRFTAWFSDYDALITPTTAQASAPAAGWLEVSWTKFLFMGSQQAPMTNPWNVAGFPAASVPGGLTADGFPLGVQVVAPRGGEALVLSIAAQMEQLRPWPRHAPMADLIAVSLATA